MKEMLICDYTHSLCLKLGKILYIQTNSFIIFTYSSQFYLPRTFNNISFIYRSVSFIGGRNHMYPEKTTDRPATSH